MEGFLLIDKPKGWTSFDIVKKIRGLSGVRKVGHSGTLDPLATGLLIVALGKATKLLTGLIGCDKEYEVVACFGAVSDTYDAEGKISVVEGGSFDDCTEDSIRKIISENFLGEIEQIPPQYSAVKVGGRKAYDIARGGGSVELKPRKIRVDSFDIVDFKLEPLQRQKFLLVKFLIKCGSGTYVRSLVHDLGKMLGCGAYVEELRRIKVGKFNVDKAVQITDLLSGNIEQCLFF